MLSSKLPQAYCNLQFDAPITRWDEALPLGNGLTGCLIWGESHTLQLSLDRGDLWDTTPYPGTSADNFNFKNLVHLVHTQQQQVIRDIFDTPYYYPTPTKLPAGKLILSFKKGLSVSSLLDIGTAHATIKLNQGSTQVECYLHATERTGFIKITGDTSDFSYELIYPKFGLKGESDDYVYDVEHREISHGSLKLLKYPSPIIGQEGSLKWFIQPVNDSLSFAILVATKVYPTHQEIVYRISTSLDGEDWFNQERNILLHHLELGYQNCLISHQAWWYKFWNQSAVHLPEPLFEKNWYLSNYLFGSCSRKGCPPMPLQGVWTADNGQLPPWKGDYHNDLNTQMCYYHYLKANHMEEGESFIDFLWQLNPAAQKFAQKFYGAKGLCLPAVMSIDGQPLGGWPMYSLSITNHLWLCQAFERHARFSGDIDFLRTKVYPYFKESAQCLLDILQVSEAGYYSLPVSSSPELHDDELESWVTPNSNYDLALMLYLFKQLHLMSITLENNDTKIWESVLNKFAPLAVNEQNVLLISPTESLQESQRHHSHLMAIHPLRLLDYNTFYDRQIIDASILNLEHLGTGLWVGFSFPWFAELFAIQKNGEGAYYQLKRFWENFCSPNGFHLNGDYMKRGLTSFHYRPFTLEANMCSADALQEMLLQTENNIIDVFPAIPQVWQKQELGFETLRGEKGILISAQLKNKVVTRITLQPQRDGVYNLVNKWGALPHITPNCDMNMQNNLLILVLKQGITYHITPTKM